ncbi:MAG: capsule biosynthesis protein [Marinosulfonomonas sp.]|nr:capsule biosynthesis protein [Marinosulfonomonas sp.]
MTTKPKAKKYRIRRSGSLAEPLNKLKAAVNPSGADTGPTHPALDENTPVEDGFGDQAYPTAQKPAETASKSISAEIEAIKKEGLTGRQLRMARRVAQKNRLAPTSDYDAIRQLRQKGIDPFKRTNMLELVSPEDKANASAPNLPKTVETGTLPSTEVMSEDGRAREIYRIQQDIAQRRRRKLLLLVTRLSFFVFLPTFIVGLYYYVVATPLYATKSEFLIQQADSQGGGSMGGLFSGTGFATSQDSIAVQSYLQSREAMLRLDSDIGFKSHFSQDFVDPLQRLETDSTNEEAYRLYQRLVKIGYDPTEGIVKMEVIAADPATSALFSRALINYAEEQVDNLTQRLRGDQMRGSRESFQDAEFKMKAAQERVLSLQERLGVIDAVTETSAVMSQVTNFEIQLQEKRLQLQQLLDNQRPNQARVDGVQGDISRLSALIAELRAQLTSSGNNNTSLARISGELRMAQVDLETRQVMMQQSLQQLETARIEANRQVRYLSLGVSPTPPDEPTYPRAFENTIVAFFIFSGIYLMASLTASILREQVSS